MRATSTPGMCVSACVCVLDQHTCDVVTKVKGSEWGGGGSSCPAWNRMAHRHSNPDTHTLTHKCTFAGKGASGRTFNLPADLSEVGHPFEDFGVSCLVSMRGLQRIMRNIT